MCDDKDAWGRPMFPPYETEEQRVDQSIIDGIASARRFVKELEGLTNKSGDITNYQSSGETTDNGYTPEPTKEYNEKGIVEETEEHRHDEPLYKEPWKIHTKEVTMEEIREKFPIPDEQRIAEIRERVKPPYDNDYYRKYFPEPDVMFLLTLLDEARGKITIDVNYGSKVDYRLRATPVELHLQGTVEKLKAELKLERGRNTLMDSLKIDFDAILKKDNEELKSTVESLRKALDEEREETQRLLEIDYISENTKLKERVAELEEANEGWRDEWRTAEAKVKELEAQWLNPISNADFRKAYEHSEAKCKSLEEQLTEANTPDVTGFQMDAINWKNRAEKAEKELDERHHACDKLDECRREKVRLKAQLAEAKQTIGIQASTIVGLTEELHEVKVSNDSVKGIKSEVTRLRGALVLCRYHSGKIDSYEDIHKIVNPLVGSPEDYKDCSLDVEESQREHEKALAPESEGGESSEIIEQLESEVTRLRGALEKVNKHFLLQNRHSPIHYVVIEALAIESEGGEG